MPIIKCNPIITLNIQVGQSSLRGQSSLSYEDVVSSEIRLNIAECLSLSLSFFIFLSPVCLRKNNILIFHCSNFLHSDVESGRLSRFIALSEPWSLQREVYLMESLQRAVNQYLSLGPTVALKLRIMTLTSRFCLELMGYKNCY